LRKPGETGYKIPTGGLFDYITGANFFGEIIEWTGFAVASDCSPPATIFAVFSAAYLGMRAWHHQNYYLSKFEDYPRTRKIIIPFVF
jgi:3-oxo-5-alpha-steroid 4-dehydrogenase 1